MLNPKHKKDKKLALEAVSKIYDIGRQLNQLKEKGEWEEKEKKHLSSQLRKYSRNFHRLLEREERLIGPKKAKSRAQRAPQIAQQLDYNLVVKGFLESYGRTLEKILDKYTKSSESLARIYTEQTTIAMLSSLLFSADGERYKSFEKLLLAKLGKRAEDKNHERKGKKTIPRKKTPEYNPFKDLYIKDYLKKGIIQADGEAKTIQSYIDRKQKPAPPAPPRLLGGIETNRLVVMLYRSSGTPQEGLMTGEFCELFGDFVDSPEHYSEVMRENGEGTIIGAARYIDSHYFGYNADGKLNLGSVEDCFKGKYVTVHTTPDEVRLTQMLAKIYDVRNGDRVKVIFTYFDGAIAAVEGTAKIVGSRILIPGEPRERRDAISLYWEDENLQSAYKHFYSSLYKDEGVSRLEKGLTFKLYVQKIQMQPATTTSNIQT